MSSPAPIIFEAELRAADLAGEPPPALPDPAVSPERSPRQTGVLVVDDRPEKRQAIHAVLSDLHHRIVLAESGVDALRYLLREEFAVIVLDLNMPDMDGLELAAIIRTRRRCALTPIIFYTADADTAARKLSEAYDLGAVDLLVAPIPAQVLRAKVAVFAEFHRRLVDVRRVADERERLMRAEAARADAERASAAKDHFLATLSHELRTPLSPVLNTIDLLLESSAHPPQLRRELEMIRRNVALEARLIDDLLDLTRVSRGKVVLHLETVDVHECLDRVLEICRTEIGEKQIVVTVDPGAKRNFVQADVIRLKQIFWNLVRNAVKFSQPGGIVALRTRDAEGNRICVEVSDSGAGIGADLLPTIFEAFRQGAHSVGGLGLGLAITHSLVQLHRGTIQAQSEGVGRGATFTVYLSCMEPGAGGCAPEPPPAPPVMKRRLAARILLVEDHVDTRFSLERLLLHRGYTVATAHSVASALEQIQKVKFDLVVSDIGLPDGTGHELIRQIHQSNSCCAIALSGFGMDEDISRSASSGFDRHLTKPINFAELDEVIQALLEGRIPAAA